MTGTERRHPPRARIQVYLLRYARRYVHRRRCILASADRAWRCVSRVDQGTSTGTHRGGAGCLRRSLLIGTFTPEIVGETTGFPPVHVSNERDRRDGLRQARV